jgi:hypothetical protein
MSAKLSPEERARVLIDEQLAQAGWVVQDRKDIDLVNHVGVAVRETILKSVSGRADYLLYLNRKIVGVIEAKPSGVTLTEVQWQSHRYSKGLDSDQTKIAVLHRDEFRQWGQLALPGCTLEVRRALEFWPLLGDAASRAVAGGAALFMLSDAILGVDRFVLPLPLAPLWVLGCYFVAQILIVLNTRPARSPAR